MSALSASGRLLSYQIAPLLMSRILMPMSMLSSSSLLLLSYHIAALLMSKIYGNVIWSAATTLLLSLLIKIMVTLCYRDPTHQNYYFALNLIFCAVWGRSFGLNLTWEGGWVKRQDIMALPSTYLVT